MKISNKVLKMKHFFQFRIVVIFVLLSLLESCHSTRPDTSKFNVDQYLSEAKNAITQTIEQGYKYEAIPKALKEDGSFHFCGRSWDWMEGLF